MGSKSSKANKLSVIFKKGLINTMTLNKQLSPIPDKDHNLPFRDLQEEQVSQFLNPDAAE